MSERTEFLERFKDAGFSDFEIHEAADGQLMFHLGSGDEMKLFEELQAEVAKVREEVGLKLANGEATEEEAKKFGQETTNSPLYLQDDSKEGRFWLMMCLRARKYDLERALIIYFNYLKFRVDFGIGDVNDPDEEETKAVLNEDVMRCAGNTDKSGRYIWGFDGGNFFPKNYTPRIVTRALHHLIDHLMRKHPDASIKGIITIGNLRGYGLANFDPDTEKMFIESITNNIPLRQGGFFLINAPFIIKMIMPIAKLFMKKKMRNRLNLVHKRDLLRDIDENHLDVEYGGTFVRDKLYIIYPDHSPIPEI
eukprot:m.34258 g.34258  ORF g.34258 m.34258 type:complete len:308 (-) comp6510_c0_seq1:180-1103(-)